MLCREVYKIIFEVFVSEVRQIKDDDNKPERVRISIKYCRLLQLCHKLMNATFETADAQKGKRYSTPICAVCCGDDYCNSYACETIKRE